MTQVAAQSARLPKIRTLIVDDETLAREKIRMLLGRDPDVEVVGEAANGQDAIALVEDTSPELMFLDVQMPGIDGFGVLEAIGARRVPAVVFVTAYDQHALKAFEVHALDYLLKPFAQKRFRETLERVKDYLRTRRDDGLGKQLMALLSDIGAEKHHPGRFVVKTGGKVFFLKADDIDWVEASGNYVNLHTKGEAHLLRETMNSIEARLDPQRFVRIHRSTIVNIDRIKELSPLFHGDHVVTLLNGTRLTLSRSYRDRLSKIMHGEL
jgi:two-component system LytT family response regulator